MRWAPALLVAFPALAGCLSGSDGGSGDGPPRAPDGSVDWAALVGAPVVQDHDHADPGLHADSLNVRRVGWTTGEPDDAFPAGTGWTEFFVQSPYVYLGRAGATGGFSIVDVSDPAAPLAVGSFVAEGASDLEVSADGHWAFLSTQRNGPPELTGLVADPTSRLPRGTYVVDVSDKTAPRFESFFPLPTNGPHTITYAEVAGRQLVIHCTYDLVTNPASAQLVGASPATQRVLITELTTDATGAHVLRPLSTYQRPDVPPAGKIHIPHDVTVWEHPVTGQTLMVVAYWDLGVRFVDISDPTDPIEIGAFADFAPSAWANIHQARPFPAPIDGRWVVVAEPELVTAEESGQITFIDATDPTAPTKLGDWTLPGEIVIPEPFLFSPHNFDVDAEGRVFLGHNHAGVWVIDVGAIGSPEAPVATGYSFTDVAREDQTRSTSVWGVVEDAGLLYVSDTVTGLYVLEYGSPVAP